jgi:CheY-like chemotaxis protein
MATVVNVGKVGSWLRRGPRGWLHRPARAPRRPRTLLIVDPTPADRAAMRRVVEGLGFQVVEANNGAEALRRAAAEQPDWVLLALDLPGRGGLDVLADLRAATPDASIAVLTRDVRDPRTAQAMRRGALTYLAKPFGADDLRELLPR